MEKPDDPIVAFLSNPQNIKRSEWARLSHVRLDPQRKERILENLCERLDEATMQPGTFDEHFLPAIHPFFSDLEERKKGRILENLLKKSKSHLPKMEPESLEKAIEVMEHPENKAYLSRCAQGNVGFRYSFPFRPVKTGIQSFKDFSQPSREAADQHAREMSWLKIPPQVAAQYIDIKSGLETAQQLQDIDHHQQALGILSELTSFLENSHELDRANPLLWFKVQVASAKSHALLENYEDSKRFFQKVLEHPKCKIEHFEIWESATDVQRSLPLYQMMKKGQQHCTDQRFKESLHCFRQVEKAISDLQKNASQPLIDHLKKENEHILKNLAITVASEACSQGKNPRSSREATVLVETIAALVEHSEKLATGEIDHLLRGTQALSIPRDGTFSQGSLLAKSIAKLGENPEKLASEGISNLVLGCENLTRHAEILSSPEAGLLIKTIDDLAERPEKLKPHDIAHLAGCCASLSGNPHRENARIARTLRNLSKHKDIDEDTMTYLAVGCKQLAEHSHPTSSREFDLLTETMATLAENPEKLSSRASKHLVLGCESIFKSNHASSLPKRQLITQTLANLIEHPEKLKASDLPGQHEPSVFSAFAELCGNLSQHEDLQSSSSGSLLARTTLKLIDFTDEFDAPAVRSLATACKHFCQDEQIRFSHGNLIARSLVKLSVHPATDTDAAEEIARSCRQISQDDHPNASSNIPLIAEAVANLQVKTSKSNDQDRRSRSFIASSLLALSQRVNETNFSNVLGSLTIAVNHSTDDQPLNDLAKSFDNLSKHFKKKLSYPNAAECYHRSTSMLVGLTTLMSGRGIDDAALSLAGSAFKNLAQGCDIIPFLEKGVVQGCNRIIKHPKCENAGLSSAVTTAAYLAERDKIESGELNEIWEAALEKKHLDHMDNATLSIMAKQEKTTDATLKTIIDHKKITLDGLFLFVENPNISHATLAKAAKHNLANDVLRARIREKRRDSSQLLSPLEQMKKTFQVHALGRSRETVTDKYLARHKPPPRGGR